MTYESTLLSSWLEGSFAGLHPTNQLTFPPNRAGSSENSYRFPNTASIFAMAVASS